MRKVSFGLSGLTAQAAEPTRRGYGEEIRRTVDIAVLAEKVGFDSVWLSEHHFASDGYLPSPWSLLGAMAASTDRLTLGTSVILAPLHQPLRLAEEAAIIDQLSGGRFVLGMGLGYRTEEWKAFGVEPAKRLAVLHDCIDICRRSWRGDPVTGLGLLDDQHAVNVRPLPSSQAGPPIWLGSGVEAGVRRAARIADGYIAPPVDLAHFREFTQWLTEERAIERCALATSIFGFVAPSDARKLVAPSVQIVDEQYRYWRSLETSTVMPTSRARDQEETMLDSPGFVVGTPEEVVDMLRPWYEMMCALPGDAPAHLTIRLTWPSLGKAAEEAISLFGREVIPALRS